MGKRYETPEEITKDFIKKGWSEDTTFTEVTFEEVKDSLYGIARGMCNGHKYFKMNGNGNIYNERGEVAFYNIPCIKGETQGERYGEKY